MLLPFFDHYLKDGAPGRHPARARSTTPARTTGTASTTGRSPATAVRRPATPLYLQAGCGLGFDGRGEAGDSYVSDPAKPVPSPAAARSLR
ncbi:MAG: hypothetical protein QM757_11185 [Paludibaculum sp.]